MGNTWGRETFLKSHWEASYAWAILLSLREKSNWPFSFWSMIPAKHHATFILHHVFSSMLDFTGDNQGRIWEYVLVIGSEELKSIVFRAKTGSCNLTYYGKFNIGVVLCF